MISIELNAMKLFNIQNVSEPDKTTNQETGLNCQPKDRTILQTKLPTEV
jgi:hypothetical protein